MKGLFFMGLAVASAAVRLPNADALSHVKRTMATVSGNVNALPSRIKPLHGLRRLSNDMNLTATCKTAMDSLYAIPCVKAMVLPSEITDPACADQVLPEEFGFENCAAAKAAGICEMAKEYCAVTCAIKCDANFTDPDVRKVVGTFLDESCTDCLTKIDVIQAANVVKDKCSRNDLNTIEMGDESFVVDISNICSRDSKGKLCMSEQMMMMEANDKFAELISNAEPTTEEELETTMLRMTPLIAQLCGNECMQKSFGQSGADYMCQKFDGQWCFAKYWEKTLLHYIDFDKSEMSELESLAKLDCDPCTRLVGLLAKRSPDVPAGGECNYYSDNECVAGYYCSSAAGYQGVCTSKPSAVAIGEKCSDDSTAPIFCEDGISCSNSICTKLLVLGAVCNPSMAECDVDGGMYCKSVNSTSGTCQLQLGVGMKCQDDYRECAGYQWCTSNNVFDAKFCGDIDDVVDGAFGAGSCVAPPKADSCKLMMAKFVVSQDCTVAKENECCFAYDIDLRTIMKEKCKDISISTAVCKAVKTFQDVTLTKALTNVNGAYFTANKDALLMRLYQDLEVAYFPHEIQKGSVKATLVNGDALDISFKVKDNIVSSGSHTDVKVEQKHFKRAMMETNFIFPSIVPTGLSGGAAAQMVEINIKTTASFATALTTDAQTKVKTAYCKAASVTFGVASSKVTCTIAQTSGSRRLLAGVSYDMSADILVDEATATAAVAEMAQTSAQITNVFVAQSDVTDANGGVAMTADAVTVSQEVKIEQVEVFDDSGAHIQTACSLSAIAFLVACLA